jgi:plastocyanin
MLARRSVLGAAAGLLAGAARFGVRADEPAAVIEVHMRSEPQGQTVGFNPIGVLLQPGQTVRWICDANVHTAASYSPANDDHSLRIPENAQPWASDYLLPGQRFEVRLTVEGVYDYFCAPHKEAGMVGRLIVGRPVGPGAPPFDYFKGERKHWKPVPPAAQRAFPSIDEILQRKVVPSPLNFSA